MKTTFFRASLGFALICLFLGPGGRMAGSDAVGTIVVLDASGSMQERIKGETKMAIAKQAIAELVSTLPAGMPLGLVVYSHRKGNSCEDIELVVAPAPLDAPAFVAAIDPIKPNGRTPLSAALEFAATTLDYTKQPANIILLSDGLETCGKDPCATVGRLKAAAKQLTVHAVAFDLSARDAKMFECIATLTGGRFLQAADARSLQDALSVAAAETVARPADAPAAPAEDLSAATVVVPPTVVAGAEFAVTWTGPNNSSDFVTIVPPGTPDRDYANFAYTRQGSPLNVTALLDAGPAEVRYVTGRSHTVLARAAIEIVPTEVSLQAVSEAIAGARIAVTWTGPSNAGDYVTIVPAGTEDGVYAQYAYTRDGNPLSIPTPPEVGAAEVRYMSGQGRRVLARRTLTLLAASVTLAAPETAVAGSAVTVEWTGPNNDRDYITIVEQGAPDGSYQDYSDTTRGPTLQIRAPMTPGPAEIRYMGGTSRAVLTRRPLTVVAATVTLSAPETAVAGSDVQIAWTGPNNNGDYITIVPKALPEGRYAGYQYTTAGSPLQVIAPMDAGPAEVRYVSGQGARTLARVDVMITTPLVTLSAPGEAALGTQVEITWTGPNNRGDYITIVPRGSPEGNYERYAPTTSGSPLRVGTPAKPGPCEVRYVSGQGGRTLGRIEILVRAP